MFIDSIVSSELSHTMNNWRIWALSGNSIALGYPTSSPSCREYQHRSGNVWSAPSCAMIDEHGAEKIDDIVLALPDDLKRVVCTYHLKTGSAKSKISRMGMAKGTFYEKLKSAYRIIYIALVNLK